MAIVGVDRGTGTNTAATTFTTFTTATNFTAGSLALLCIAADNSGNSANNITSVTDALGNSWTKWTSTIYDVGAASTGVQGSFFTTNMDRGVLTTSDNITTTYGANTTSDTWTLMEITPTAGYKIRVVNFGDGTGVQATANQAMSMTTESITNGNMVVCAIYSESGTTQSYTPDSDTTNGSWSTIQYAEVGSTTTGSVIGSQRKVVTGTATQTYNITGAAAQDAIMSWIQLTEEANIIRDVICDGGLVVRPRTLDPA